MSCKARIQIDSTQLVYTSGDIVFGKLYVDLSKEFEISEIVVKLAGEEYVIITTGQATYTKTLKFHEDSTQVFPQPELKVVGMDQYTLQGGTYEYPFSFQIPGHKGDAPAYPKLDESNGHVRYHVKATIRRPSTFKFNTRTEFHLLTLPCTDEKILAEASNELATNNIIMLRKRSIITGMFSDSSQKPTLSGELHIARQGYAAGTDNMDIHVILKKNDMLGEATTVTHITVLLRRRAHYVVPNIISTTRHKKIPIMNEAVSLPLKFDGSSVNISELMKEARFPSDTMPSFSTHLINVSYRIHVKLHLVSGKATRTMEMKAPIVVCSPIVHQHDYLEHMPPPLFTAENEDLPEYDGDSSDEGDNYSNKK